MLPTEPREYDVDELRESAGLEPIEEVKTPNYECTHCDWPQYVDDHKRHAPNFCEMCGEVRTFERIQQ